MLPITFDGQGVRDWFGAGAFTGGIDVPNSPKNPHNFCNEPDGFPYPKEVLHFVVTVKNCTWSFFACECYE